MEAPEYPVEERPVRAAQARILATPAIIVVPDRSATEATNNSSSQQPCILAILACGKRSGLDSQLIMIHATRKELERAFRFHIALAGASESLSKRLLLTYAVECGLKALIMAHERAEITSRLKAEIGHDLREALKRAGASQKLAIRNVMTKQQLPQAVQPKQLHETFRYGIHINDEGVVADLRAITEWIQQRL